MEQQVGCSLRLTGILVGLAITIALLLRLPSVYLVRIGIVLDGLALVLVTPKLLGTARLARIEEETRALAHRLWHGGYRVARFLCVAPGAIGFPFIATLAYIIVGGLSGFFLYIALRLVFLLLSRATLGGSLSGEWLSKALVWSSADAILLGLFLLLNSLNLVVLESYWLLERVDRREPAGRRISKICTYLLLVFTPFPGHFLIGIANLLIGLPALLISRVAGRLRRALEMRGRIVELMVPLGVAVFIVGEVYQFMGTF
jgi:hypothetical protein